MNNNFKRQAQGGFTLIELIVVIVILGILAATALPKFVDLGADARKASLQGAKGAIASASAMVRSKFVVDPSKYAASADQKMTFEGKEIRITSLGYAEAGSIAVAAGLESNDYTITQGTNQVTISPKGVATASVATCSVIYKEANGEITMNATDCK